MCIKFGQMLIHVKVFSVNESLEGGERECEPHPSDNFWKVMCVKCKNYLWLIGNIGCRRKWLFRPKVWNTCHFIFPWRVLSTASVGWLMHSSSLTSSLRYLTTLPCNFHFSLLYISFSWKTNWEPETHLHSHTCTYKRSEKIFWYLSSDTTLWLDV